MKKSAQLYADQILAVEKEILKLHEDIGQIYFEASQDGHTLGLIQIHVHDRRYPASSEQEAFDL